VDIVTSKLCEEAFFDSQQAIDHLQRAIRAQDKKALGTIRRTAVFKLVRKLFPGKSRENMLKLRFAIVAHSPEDGIVNYLELFHEDTNGNQTRFVEYLRSQHVEESQELLIDVEEDIRARASDGGVVTIADVKAAIKELDAAMPEAVVNKIAAVGFRVAVEATERMDERAKEHVDTFIARVRANVFVKRYSPRVARSRSDDDDERRDDNNVSSLSDDSD
jgi:hypothetical protein